MTRHEVRRWLGGKSLRDFHTEGELLAHFDTGNLMSILGNQYNFDEWEDARNTALRMWRELYQKEN